MLWVRFIRSKLKSSVIGNYFFLSSKLLFWSRNQFQLHFKTKQIKDFVTCLTSLIVVFIINRSYLFLEGKKWIFWYYFWLFCVFLTAKHFILFTCLLLFGITIPLDNFLNTYYWSLCLYITILYTFLKKINAMDSFWNSLEVHSFQHF